MSLKIIGISGTNGSGKDTVGHMLAERHNWLYISISENLLIPELKRQGRSIDREDMSELSAQWRRQFGGAVLIDKAIEKFKTESQTRQYEGLAIASLRHPDEADHIHEFEGLVVWVDADPRIRYQRIHGRGQGAKDQKTFEEFVIEQRREMLHSGDAATLSMDDVKVRADIFLRNDGHDIEAFKDAAEKNLGLTSTP